MTFMLLSRSEAASAWQEWLDMPEGQLPAVNSDYLKMRCDIESIYNDVLRIADENNCNTEYFIDYKFGLMLYDYLNNTHNLSVRKAADDSFWRYLSLKVCPHLIEQRWGKDNEGRYWSRPSRIWFRQIWWYVHLSWQNDMETTEEVLKSPRFSTDTILNLVERTGRKGTYIEVYKYIMYYYQYISETEMQRFKSLYNSKGRKDDLFRIIMKLNTAKTMVIEPALYEGGTDGYVRSLFEDAGIKVK